MLRCGRCHGSILQPEDDGGRSCLSCGEVEYGPHQFKKPERKRWALLFDCCAECGTTEQAHTGFGMCRPCYEAWVRSGRGKAIQA